MFDLEQAIAGWRKPMRATGIKAKALEELESHLRQEIEQQMKAGLSEQAAFNLSTQQLGQPKILRQEFSKAEGKNIRRTLMLCIGWIATCFILLVTIAEVEFTLNLFNWSPHWDWCVPISSGIALASITAIWFLAKASRDRATRVVSLLACLFLVYIAFRLLPDEPTNHAEFLGRSESSPLWYRCGLAFLLCVPGIFWFWWERRRFIQRHDSQQPNLSAASS